MFLRKSHEKIRISHSYMRVHIELCAGDNQHSHFKMLIFQQLFKHHASLLLQKCCVENKNLELFFQNLTMLP